MNERFKELAEQAGFVMWADESWKPEGQVVDWSSSYDNELSKFVELIIRECDQYVAKHWDEMEPWMNPGDLLTHFGVEE